MNFYVFKLVVSLENKPKKPEVELLKKFTKIHFLPLWKMSIS